MRKTILMMIMVMLISSTTIVAQNQLRPRENRIRSAVVMTSREVSRSRMIVKEGIRSSREKTYVVQQHLRRVQSNLDSLTPEQLTLIKNSIQEIRTYQEGSNAFLGRIVAYDNRIRKAREEKDYETLIQVYNEILVLQKHRIERLDHYNKLLDRLIKGLSNIGGLDGDITS
ncbi:conserved exported protein of unknown function [Petrocella atlantisensis]|uniref:Uncharacterized protein n=1 Tax=Petrocella atlantisensis TaxID=2173034 RepID=A0A3P7PUJ8_9FIRM|nr:hypothetical protein [Petrocella atlantisensis]MCF8017891.1 hypothetical protein [Vallitaleaceae bacterium]VDN47627.1 conserved exported protein of unknown function [Petrocella atlantisensis]